MSANAFSYWILSVSEVFSGWAELARVVFVGTTGYIVLLMLLRVIGQRALAKMNAFDFVTTVALGSALASATLSKDVTIDKAAVAFCLLLGLQRLVAWGSSRWPWFRHLTHNEPVLLARDGQMLWSALRKAHLTETDIAAALRAKGHTSIDETAAVILETDGGFSVIGKSEEGPKP